MKKCGNFLIYAPNISLCLNHRIKVYPCKPRFSQYKVGLQGCLLNWRIKVMYIKTIEWIADPDGPFNFPLYLHVQLAQDWYLYLSLNPFIIMCFRLSENLEISESNTSLNRILSAFSQVYPGSDEKLMKVYSRKWSYMFFLMWKNFCSCD